MVTVFNFKVSDAGCGGWVYSRFKATVDYIEKSRGEIVAGSEQQVCSSALDGEGRYRPERAQMRLNKLQAHHSHDVSTERTGDSVMVKKRGVASRMAVRGQTADEAAIIPHNDQSSRASHAS
jgi:hypothetical protein